ncbi:MAG: nucleoside triphosphate pyrophosphohydrolase [Immundisolibacteraceae bacterium]|nr:nucleoside triphosphate pyrophosphohydrolase [Immundisolibacteraceae bacterium]
MDQTKRLLEIMAQLRDPKDGCEWDLRQDFSTVAPYTIEEAYEVADAIERQDYDDLQDELGDLLLQVAFHAQMANELGLFDFEQVARSISDKLVRRHPHVFAGVVFETDEERRLAWEQIKAQERALKPNKAIDTSALAGVTAALPGLMRADKLQRRAADVGFDWPDPLPVFDKINEELMEVREAMEAGDQAHIAEEIGDLQFAVVNLARHLKVEPEPAMQSANLKFERRFRAVETELNRLGIATEQADLELMDQIWDQVKLAEKANESS